MPRFIDFDAALAERKREPVVIRFFGRDWDLHSGLPAAVMLEVVEAFVDGEEEIQPKQAVSLMRQLVPEPVLQAWLDEGLTIDELLELMPLLVRTYMGKEGEDSEGEAETPGGSQSSSASAGGSSKPTSSESTGSTSTKGSKAA